MSTQGKISNRKWMEDVKEELKDNYIGYFAATTVHGLKYLTEPRRPWPERVLWFLGVLIGLVACILLMIKFTTRWEESPVIIAMDESHRTVWQIPFPAVTICPQAKTRTEFFNYTDYAIRYKKGSLTKDEESLLAQVQVPCRIPIRVDNNNTKIDRNATHIIKKFALVKDDVVEIANMNPFVDPEFQPILTREGVCFSFNMMPAKYMFREKTYHASNGDLQYSANATVQWDPTTGYEKDINLTFAYPRPALGVGDESGLSMTLKTKLKYLHSMCNTLGHGFQIFLTPHEIRTSQDLRDSYTPEQRQCYFHDERYLKYFKFYTQKNCELECLANITLASCGCVEFYMPRMPNTIVCGKDEFCAKRVAGNFYITEEQSPKSGKNCKKCHKIQQTPCNCLQSCAHIRYNSHHIQSVLDPETAKQILHSKELVTNEPTKRSHVSIFYKDSLFIPVRRVEVFGLSDLLASLGGLMGLCMGISLLSVIELFYWMLIRPFCQRIKQTNPQLRSIKKQNRTQNVETAVQYSPYCVIQNVPDNICFSNSLTFLGLI
ncbi:Pickpocket protein 19 [Gryllus bimaculatus]|nr:Pickpocket protein 19 [Gryllus bimaculatus]